MSETLKDNQVSYISAKTDKLASAVYLVTNHLADQEPLKWQLRELALKSLMFKGESRLGSAKTFRGIIDLLDLGINAGSVSVMNFSVLKNEYQSILDSIDQETANQLKASLFVKEVKEERELIPMAEKVARPALSPISRPINTLSHSNSEGKEMRQSLITKYIRGRDWTAIKDIARAVPDCSVKTVQRELTELVEQGVLKKKGDRRWSRYMLAV